MKIQFSNLKEVKLLASLGLMIIFLEQKMYPSINILVTVYLEKTTVQNFHPGLQMDHYQLDTFIMSLWNMKMM